MNKVLIELDILKVTVKSDKEQGMTSLKQLLSTTEIISVTKYLKFPSDEVYFCAYGESWKTGNSYLHMLYLEEIDDDCVVNYGRSKIVNFLRCTQMIEDNGWMKLVGIIGICL